MDTSALSGYLVRLRRRLRLIDASLRFQQSFPYAALAVAAIQILGRILPIEQLHLWSTIPLGVWFLICGLISIAAPLPLMRVARRVDLQLHLHERLSTALAYENDRLAADPDLVGKQRRDALQAARLIEPRRDLPHSWKLRPLLIAGVLLAAAVVSAVLPNRMDAVLAQRRAVQAEAARQAERVEALKEELSAAEELSPEERAELQLRLAELAERLKTNRGDLEQAVTDLSNLEKDLAARLNPNADAQAANLEALAERLSTLANRPREPQADAAATAMDALSDLAEQMKDLDPAEQQSLAAELAQLAALSAQSGDAALAGALSSLAQAIQAGDSTSAESLAQSAMDQIQAADRELEAQDLLRSAVEALQSGRAQLAQASQAALAQAGQSGSSGQSNQTGQSTQPGQGAQAGQQPGQGQTAGAVTGGGSQAGSLPPASGGSSNVRPQGEGREAPAGDLAQQVYSPWERPASGTGDTLSLPGIDTGQGTTQTSQGQSNLPGVENPALMPYNQVFYNYFSASNQALRAGHVPSALSSYVQSYFTRIAPR